MSNFLNESRYGTASLVREKYDYNPETGILRIKQHIKPKNIGKTVGAIQGHGYVGTRYKNISISVHRLIWAYWYGVWPDKCIDHINGDRSDNRLVNLRLATNQENCWNQKTQRTKKYTPLKGVGRSYSATTWRARIRHNGKLIHIGYFRTEEEAHRAYVAKAHELFGQFARAA